MADDPRKLFVYGTLRPGHPHPVAKRLAAETVPEGTARWPGLLYDMGTHPAAVTLPAPVAAPKHRKPPGTHAKPAGAHHTGVAGDLLRLRSPAHTLAWLDEYEELGAPPRTPWFVRVATVVESPDGTTHPCWLYRFERAPDDGVLIPGGDYLAHLAALPAHARPPEHTSGGKTA